MLPVRGRRCVLKTLAIRASRPDQGDASEAGEQQKAYFHFRERKKNWRLSPLLALLARLRQASGASRKSRLGPGATSAQSHFGVSRSDMTAPLEPFTF